MDTFKNQTTQSKVNALIFNFIIQDVQSFSLLEQPAFRNLIEGISGGKTVMCRKSLMRRIEDGFLAMKEKLIEKLQTVSYVCTTADIWTAHNRSFFGMTCACARIKGRHTYDVIAEKIQQIHEMFNIERKVQATFTDNGSNFVKAFREFGPREEVEEGGQMAMKMLGLRMSVPFLMGKRCASHTLNLIASKDLERAVSQGATRKLFYSAMAKCSAIWNKAHRSPLAAEAVEEIMKMKLIIPCVTRWNSEYNAVQKIVSLTDAQLAEVCERLAVPKLLANELAFLNEYAEVLKPLASLQTLNKRLSDKKPHVRFFSEVIETVINAIDSRFQKWFSSREAKLATASSPQFRLWWLPEKEKEDVLRMLVAEALKMEPAVNTTAAAPASSDSGEEDFFSYAMVATPQRKVQVLLLRYNSKIATVAVE
ncbi:hypothetical protein F7725_012022 [Dissostichus mawsoni]|uniref:Transposase n=1 Tax=Dissostichus mawsoni TaxID=36200 RepID=A0A7J5ZCF8_DISMA|nr:hypothetical protein F7725_012022 [Dissostichus mawsoni]